MERRVLRRIHGSRQPNRNEVIGFIALLVILVVVVIFLFYLKTQSSLQQHHCCTINILSPSKKTLFLKADSDVATVLFKVTNVNNMSIVEGLTVKCQAVLPNGEQTDRITIEPKTVQIEPLGYGGDSREYKIVIKTHNTPPGKYIIRLQAAYNDKPQSNMEEIIIYVEH